MTGNLPKPKLAAELKDLRARLAEAEEALRAIRNGQVDAVLVNGEHGEKIYTLVGADRIYRKLIETMSEGALILSADGVILYCNICLAKMLGRPLNQVLGTALHDYLTPADQQALDAILAQILTEISHLEINLKFSGDRLVPVYLSVSRLQSEEAEMVFCLVLTDLTEQKSHEQIVAAERLSRLIFEQAAETIIVCNEKGQVIRASQSVQQFCDGSPLLRPFAEVLPLRTDTSDSFHLVPVLQGETLRNVDVTLDRQGQKFVLILNASPLLNGQQILGCVVTLTNITERRRVEDTLRESEERFRSIFDNSNDGILVADTTTRKFLFGNPAICRMLGYTSEELMTLGIKDIVLQKDLLLVMEAFEKQMRREIELSSSVPIQKKDGSVFYADINSFPLKMGDKNCLVGVFRDITERKHKEEQIKSQLEELTRWQDVMLEREDRVQELKREVNELCRRIGETTRYPSQKE